MIYSNEEGIEVKQSEEVRKAQAELLKHLNGLQLPDNSQTDKALEKLREYVTAVQKNAFLEGFDLGIRFSNSNNKVLSFSKDTLLR